MGRAVGAKLCRGRAGNRAVHVCRRAGAPRMLGVMRALGFTSRHLVGATVGEAVLLTALAIPLGTLLALGLSRLIVWLDPVYLLPVTEPDALIRTTAVAIILSVVGALVPLRALMRLDPATAFRG